MIKSVNTCLTCENLVDSLKCIKHDISVEIDNVCNDHNIKAVSYTHLTLPTKA